MREEPDHDFGLFPTLRGTALECLTGCSLPGLALCGVIQTMVRGMLLRCHNPRHLCSLRSHLLQHSLGQLGEAQPWLKKARQVLGTMPTFVMSACKASRPCTVFVLPAPRHLHGFTKQSRCTAAGERAIKAG